MNRIKNRLGLAIGLTLILTSLNLVGRGWTGIVAHFSIAIGCFFVVYAFEEGKK